MPNTSNEDTGLSPDETLHIQDRIRRMAEEKEILEKAKSLTNGMAGDPTLTGEVAYWQVVATIKQEKLLRTIVNQLHLFQTKDGCQQAHDKKTWTVKVFGTSYQMPISIAVLVLGFLGFMFLKKNNII